jgi:taurine dioxygenase
MPDSSFDNIICRPVTPAIGAEVELPGREGAIHDMAAGVRADLQQALHRFKVIVLRNQSLDEAELLAFSRNFGHLMQLPYIRPLADYPEIIAVLKEADEVKMGVFGGDWHSDFSFLDAPPRYSILYSVQVPETGGDTVWVNMAAAFQALDKDYQDHLRHRYVVHTGAPYGVANAPPEDTQFKGSIHMDRNNPEADRETFHPAVCVHPDTGEEMLFISPTYTTRFAETDRENSRAELTALYAHCTRPEFCCRIRWQADMIVIWDNRSTMHYAVNDYDGHRRLMHRTTITGHAPRGTAQLTGDPQTRAAIS